MFKVHNLDLHAHTGRFLFLLLILAAAHSKVYADFGHRNDTQSNQFALLEELPVNLDNYTLAELLDLRKQHYSQLQSIQDKSNSLKTSERKLLSQLLAYDNIRLKITDVIKKLIDEYNVHGAYKKKLLGYCQTFNTTIKTARNSVQTLTEYKMYGVQFALVYASLVYTFKENPEFYTSYQQDIENPDSTLGAYITELNQSYRKVELARKEYDVELAIQQLKQSIAKLDGAIVKRRTRLLTQH